MTRREKWIYAALLLANIPALYFMFWLDDSPRASLYVGELLTLGICAVIVRAAILTVRQRRSSKLLTKQRD